MLQVRLLPPSSKMYILTGEYEQQNTVVTVYMWFQFFTPHIRGMHTPKF
jgi:hypothetical protein